jgi:hypothetical protein
VSDTYLKLIPGDSSFVPEPRRHQLAIDKLRMLAPDGEDAEARVYDRVEFIDQGEYLEAVICPLCDSRLEVDYFSEDDPIRAWWDNAMIEADLTRGAGTFKLNDQCTLEMPCCRRTAKFTYLRFDSSAGFARFELAMLNPDIERPLPEEHMRELEAILGCKLVQVWARY